MLLLTDGEPTAGLKDFNSIMQQVGQQKAQGISITALGFGGEYNEELMAGIARRSGGNYYYIQRPDLLPEVFRRELETLMTIVAKNVRVRFQLSRWVQSRQVHGYQPSFSGRTVEISLPTSSAERFELYSLNSRWIGIRKVCSGLQKLRLFTTM